MLARYRGDLVELGDTPVRCFYNPGTCQEK